MIGKFKKKIILKTSVFMWCLFLFFSFSAREYEIQFHTVNLNNKINNQILKKAGITKVFIRVFENKNSNKGLFFKNSVFRVANPILNKLISNPDFKDLQVWAWMISRKFNWIKQSEYFDFEYQGGRKKRIKKLDVFNPEALKKIISVYRELARKKISGILIQDDLYIGHNEGFSNWGKAQFGIDTGIRPKEKLMVNKKSICYKHWIRTKTNQINKVLKLIVRNCKAVNPEIKIGMNIYYETPLFTKRSGAWYSHNLKDITNTGIDFIYLMSYHRQIKKEMKLTEEKNRALFKKIITNAHKICQDKLVELFKNLNYKL